MSPENVELVREMYEAYLADDIKRALSYFDADAKVDFSVRADTPIGRGPQAIAEIVSSWQAAFDGYSEQIEEIRDLGDLVCVIATQRGKSKGSDAELADTFASLWEVKDGRIVGVTMYSVPEDALRAAERA